MYGQSVYSGLFQLFDFGWHIRHTDHIYYDCPAEQICCFNTTLNRQEIGDEVERGERVGTVVSVYGIDDYRRGVPVDASYAVTARISGVVRGLLRDGSPVKAGDRIGDVDPRGRTDDLDHISDKSHRVAEGVHEALLGLLDVVPERKTAESGG